MLIDRERPPSGSLCVCVVNTRVVLLSEMNGAWCVRVCACVLRKTFVDVQMVFTSSLMDEGLLAPVSLLPDTLLFKCKCVCFLSVTIKYCLVVCVGVCFYVSSIVAPKCSAPGQYMDTHSN